jgi:hypothetical protein
MCISSADSFDVSGMYLRRLFVSEERTVMPLSRELTKSPLCDIGDAFGGKTRESPFL